MVYVCNHTHLYNSRITIKQAEADHELDVTVMYITLQLHKCHAISLAT